MTNASISVVIAASTNAEGLSAAVESVLAQSFAPTEIIIAGAEGAVDAASIKQFVTDASVTIRTLTHARHPSLANDINCALPAVRGEFVSVIDASCEWSDDVLVTLYAALGTNRWCYSTAAEYELSNDCMGDVVARGHDINTVLFSRDCIPAIGELDSATSPLEFWDLALALLVCAPGSRVESSSRREVPRRTRASAIAQLLRKHASSLAPKLPNYTTLASAAIRTSSGSESDILIAQDSLSLPFLQRQSGHGSRLAFLISTPRSGSTLLQRILGKHPDIHTLPEPWIMLNPGYARRFGGVEGEYEPALAARALDGFLGQVDPGRELYPNAARAMTNQLYEAALAGSGSRIFLDKTPRYYHILPELREIYPVANYVFLLRHPLAVLRSTLATWFNNDVTAFSDNRNAIDCFDGPLKIAAAIKELGDSAICIRYERLVNQPASEVSRLCEQIGIKYFDGMAEYADAPLPASEFGDQGNSLRLDRPSAEFADTWRDAFSDPAMAKLGENLVERLGPDVFDVLGYDYAEALSATTRTRTNSPTNPKTPPLSADELTLAGENHFASGDLDLARNHFKQALAVEPSFTTAHNNLGVLSANDGDHEAAIIHFTAALDSDCGDRNAIINLVECAIAANRINDAATPLANYLNTAPEDGEIAGYAATIADAMADTAQAQLTSEPFSIDIEALRRAPVVLIPNELPKITIVTPSYNQGEYLEACIDSILSQNYGNLEYIIMDGGSTDTSVPIIKRYQKYLSYWQSQQDDGQYAAIEAGFKRSTGDIMAWLNSDDKYHPDALWKVSYAFSTHPQVEWLTGLYTFWDHYGTLTGVLEPVYWSRKKQLDPLDMSTVQQESTFWRRALWNKAGARLATELYYAGDWDLWTRFFAHAKLHTLEWTLGGYRYHEGQKVGIDTNAYTAEADALRECEMARLTALGEQLEEETPQPIRLDDDALRELATWRDQSQAKLDYRRSTPTEKKARNRRRNSCAHAPVIRVVTSLRRTGIEEQSAVLDSWLSAGWQVTTVNDQAATAALRGKYPNVDFITTNEITQLQDDSHAVKFKPILAAAATAKCDYVSIIKPNVFTLRPQELVTSINGAPGTALVYGDKLAINSTAVLDGIPDGYGYVFSAPKTLTSFTAGELTFGQDWWVHWLLMSAIAKGHPVHKVSRSCAFRIRKPIKAVFEEQVYSSRDCISSVLAQYLPNDFKKIPSLKLSFDVETGDFETFARSFVGRHVA